MVKALYEKVIIYHRSGVLSKFQYGFLSKSNRSYLHPSLLCIQANTLYGQSRVGLTHYQNTVNKTCLCGLQFTNSFNNGSIFMRTRLPFEYSSLRFMSTNDNKATTEETYFQKFRNIVNIFWYGCKALFTDVRLALKTRRKLGLYHKQDLSRLTREEVRHMRQTKKDLVKTFPVTFLFMVPFIGYAAPLLAYFYPKQLLSQQFWHPDQKKEFILEEYEKRSHNYLPLVKEVARTSKEIPNKDLLKFCYQILDGMHPTCEDLLQHQNVFAKHEEFSFEKIPRYHLVKLCRCWLIPTAWYLPRWFLMNALRRRIAHLHEDDLLIKRDGIEMLTPQAIEHAVHVRGLDEASLNDQSKKKWLEDWIEISCYVKGESLSFLAHSAIFKAANFEKLVRDSIDESVNNQSVDSTSIITDEK